MTMTDEAETTAEEDVLLSSHEIAPKHLKTEPETRTCPYCDKEFRKTGFGGFANLTQHVKYKHKDQPQIGKTTVPAGAKKPRGRPRKTTLPKSAAAVKAEDEKPPKRRKPAGENLALIVNGGAQFAASAGYLPLANCLAFEAPAAGQAIDVAIAGTWPDRHVIQPLVSGVEKWEAVGACLSLPVMVHLVSIYPGLRLPLEAQMRRAAEEILVLSVPTIRRRVDRNKKVTEALAELGHLDPAIASDPDPVGTIVGSFFNVAEAPSEN
jgi:hypothetical protein